MRIVFSINSVSINVDKKKIAECSRETLFSPLDKSRPLSIMVSQHYSILSINLSLAAVTTTALLMVVLQRNRSTCTMRATISRSVYEMKWAFYYMHYLYSILLWHCQYAIVLLDRSKPLLIMVSQQYYIFGKYIPCCIDNYTSTDGGSTKEE